jgi:hypothetical protein
MNENCRPKRDKVQNMWEKKSKKGHREKDTEMRQEKIV